MVFVSRSPSGGHQHIVVGTKNTAYALEDPREPEDVDHVEDDTRENEQIPHVANLMAGDWPVHRVHFVPVRRNAGYTREKERWRHRKTVQQKEPWTPWITHDVQEPPTGAITVNMQHQNWTVYSREYPGLNKKSSKDIGRVRKCYSKQLPSLSLSEARTIKAYII